MIKLDLIPGNSYHIIDINTYKELHSDMIYLGSSYVENEAYRYIELKFRFSYSTDIVKTNITECYISEAN